MIQMLLKGFANNILITGLSAILPLIIGIPLCYFASRSKIADSIFHWISIVTECLCPLVLLVAVFYLPATMIDIRLPREFVAYLALTVCFLFYMPAHFNKGDSFLKNTLYNGIGLISSIFKWSFCIGYIAVFDLLKAATNAFTSSFETLWFIVPILISVIILFILELGKRFVRQFMK